MSERRRGLGRGLGALIPGPPAEEPAVEYEESSRNGPLAGRADEALDQEAVGSVSRETPGSQDAVPPQRGPERTGDRSEERAVDRPEMQPSGKSEERPSTQQEGQSPEKSAEGRADPTERTARQPGGSRGRTVSPAARQKAMKARMDMSEALRNTTLVSRPSDMFFLPSSSVGTTQPSGADEAPASDPQASSPTDDHPTRPEPADAVSRETASEPAPEGERERAVAAGEPDRVSSLAASDAVSRETSADIEQLAAVPGATFADIPVSSIHPNRKQPRQVFDEEELAELAYSIGELGVLQPIVVRLSRENEGTTYELVMGERRWRATQRAGLPTIPAIVRETSDDDLLRDALLENLHRSQLNPLEEAAAYQQLLEEFGATQEELSRRIGRSRPQISNTIRLLRLPPLVQRRVAAGVLSSGHARALLSLSDPAEMERLAQRIVAEGLSVRATEEAVAMTEGAERKPRRTPSSSALHKERLNYIADAFADRLDTSVKIALGARKGKMTIEFASVEDLNRIVDVLDPGMDRS